jgi:hypothetical protein
VLIGFPIGIRTMSIVPVGSVTASCSSSVGQSCSVDRSITPFRTVQYLQFSRCGNLLTNSLLRYHKPVLLPLNLNGFFNRWQYTSSKIASGLSMVLLLLLPDNRSISLLLLSSFDRCVPMALFPQLRDCSCCSFSFLLVHSFTRSNLLDG